MRACRSISDAGGATHAASASSPARNAAIRIVINSSPSDHWRPVETQPVNAALTRADLVARSAADAAIRRDTGTLPETSGMAILSAMSVVVRVAGALALSLTLAGCGER